METYIALLRGINVGGNNILPMKELRSLLKKLGFLNVKTYIQTGNVVFQHEGENASQVSNEISSEIKKSFGFEPKILLLKAEEMEAAIEANPFPKAESEPSRLYLNFLVSSPSSPDLKGLEKIKKESEQFELKDNVFYLYAPEGIGRSKLASKTGKLLGVSLTSRNWRTVNKIMAMAKEIN